MRKEMSYNRMKMVKGVMILAGAAVLGGMVMWLWNCIMPDLLAGASKIDYWHALGLAAAVPDSVWRIPRPWSWAWQLARKT
jgi:hypothetical protein